MVKRYGPLVPLFMLIGFGVLGIVIGTACQPVPQGSPTPEATPTPIVIVEPAQTDEGLVYFEATDKVYWDSLKAFYKKNPTLHCDYQGATSKVEVDGWGEGRVAYTVITGHILHCHDLAIDAQELTKE